MSHVFSLPSRQGGCSGPGEIRSNRFRASRWLNGDPLDRLISGVDDLERDPNWRTQIFGQYDLHNGGLAYMCMLRTNDWKLVRYNHTNGLDERMKAIRDPTIRESQ